jgi:hypothetical protein
MRLMPAGKIYVTVPRGGFFHSRSAARNTRETKKAGVSRYGDTGVSAKTPGSSLRGERKKKI